MIANDIQEWLWPKLSWHLSYGWGKPQKKPQPGKLTSDGEMWQLQPPLAHCLLVYCAGSEVRDMCGHSSSVTEADKEEQWVVVQFFTAEGVRRWEIHHHMSAVYGDHSISCSHVLEWHKNFRVRRVSLQDGAQHPPFSSDLSPSNVHIFRELRKTFMDIVLHWMKMCVTG